jgi:hypothetical protein
MIAKEMLRRTVERHRFFAEPLAEMDKTEEEVGIGGEARNNLKD